MRHRDGRLRSNALAKRWRPNQIAGAPEDARINAVGCNPTAFLFCAAGATLALSPLSFYPFSRRIQSMSQTQKSKNARIQQLVEVSNENAKMLAALCQDVNGLAQKVGLDNLCSAVHRIVTITEPSACPTCGGHPQ